MDWLYKLLLMLLIMPYVTACTSKPIRFVSYPPGAEVRVGKSKCFAPCNLIVSQNDQYVLATSPDGRFLRVEIPKEVRENTNTMGSTLEGAGNLMTVGGLILAGISFVSASLFFSDSGNDIDNGTFESDAALPGLSAGAGIAAFSLMKAGTETTKLNTIHNRIDLDFKYSNDSSNHKIWLTPINSTPDL